MAQADDLLDSGRAAYARRSWLAAYESLSRAEGLQPLAGKDLWRLGFAACLVGRDTEFLSALERAHRRYLDDDATVDAARCAFWLGFALVSRGDVAQASGWFGRVARLIESHDECVVHGYLQLPRAHHCMVTGDLEGACVAAQRAVAFGERFDDADLRALGLHVHGRALLRHARVAEGLALLDEAMVAVASAELSPYVTGVIYCSVISACRQVYALRRAHEWTAALTQWCELQPDMLAYTGACLVHRAEIMKVRGAWANAIIEAQRAGERLAGSADRQTAAAAFYEQGEVLRLQGDFDAAEAAYREASSAGREPQPGLALLRLAQGNRDAAAAGIRRALGEATDPMVRVRLLPAAVEIMIATDALDDARAACRALDETARALDSTVLATYAAHARGAIDLAAGDAMNALVALRDAWRGYENMDAPYDAARVRALMSVACHALGDEDAATLERAAALRTFERLGAAPDIADLAGRDPHARAARTSVLTRREREVLALVATGRTNRAIAADLFISEKTVARHVSNIFGKLGVTSRAAATAYAYEHGLVAPSA